MESTPPWMPVAGRHTVSIGSSISRALKARKGEPVPAKSKLPDKDFYSFRYNFKPESVDDAKPGTIQITKKKDLTAISVERASVQAGEGLAFVGKEVLAKEWDCVLIYDEELKTFTLEKLDTYIQLIYDGRTTHAPRHPGSPLPAAPSRVASSSTASTASYNNSHTSAPLHRPPTQNEKFKAQLELEIEAELLGELEDAEGEPDEDFPPPAPAPAPSPAKPKAKLPKGSVAKSSTGKAVLAGVKPITEEDRRKLKEEEEESEDEIMAAAKAALARRAAESPPGVKDKAASRPTQTQTRVVPPSAAKPTAQPAAARPRPPQAQPAISTTSAPAAKPKTAPSRNGTKRAYAPDVEEETFDIELPSPPKRPRPSPPPSRGKEQEKAKEPDFAWPSTAAAPALPKEPAALSFPGSAADTVSLPSAPDQVDSEEEGWDEVEPVPSPALAAPMSMRKIEMEEIIPEVQAPSAPMSMRRIVMEEIIPEAHTPAADEDDEDDEMEEMEIDMTAFEAEMNQHLGHDEDGDGDEEDFLAQAVSPVEERPSKNGLNNSGIDWGDDDYTSSSEDSDDD